MTYYVYIHYKKSNGEPFYVGKGTGRRAANQTERSDFWKSVACKHGYTVEIVANNLTEAEAFNFEKVLIEKLGRRITNTGPLVNLTTGGDGAAGLPRYS